MKDTARISAEPQPRLASVISIERRRTARPGMHDRRVGRSALGEVIPFSAKDRKRELIGEVLGIINYYREENMHDLADHLAETAVELKDEDWSDSEVLESIQMIAARRAGA